MIVLDTHAWIWWVNGSKRLSAEARRKIERAKQVGLCAISCWEVAMLVERGRLRFDRDVRVWIEQALKAPALELLPLDPEVAVSAAQLARLGGDPADNMIVATARARNAELVTADERIEASGLVKTIW